MGVMLAIFFCLSAAACELMVPIETHQINKPLILRQVEEIYLQDPSIKAKYDSITDVRSEIKKYIVCRKRFSSCLDEICNNTIGEIAMKLLMVNLENKNEILFLGTGERDEFDGKRTITIKLDNYDFKNPDNYDPKGKAKTKEALCGIYAKIGDITQIVKKKDTISEAMFHELCHALHKYSGREMCDSHLLDLTYEKNEHGKSLWSSEDDEEMYTITGHHYDKKTEARQFDPISCNMFNICANILNSENIVQRVFHYNYWSYKEYLTKYNTLESEALYKIEEFLIDINKYILKEPLAAADKIMVPAKK
jgi:hypothetical protein